MNAFDDNAQKLSEQAVLIDGATGYLGSHLISALAGGDYTVRGLVHPQAKKEDIDVLTACNARIYRGSLVEPAAREAILRAFQDVQAAVHLIGSIAPKRGERLSDLHVGQTESFVNYCRQAGVQKIIMITSLGSSGQAESDYHKTKYLAEEKVRASGIPFVILRPSLIIGRTFGRRNSKLVSRYQKLIKEKSMVPLINGGENKIQPIFVGDLVQVILRCIFESPENHEIFGHEFELGGPESISTREFVLRLMRQAGVNKRIISIPTPIAWVAASIMQVVQEVPTLSVDQIRLAHFDNLCLDNALTSRFDIQPTGVDRALETYSQGDRIPAGPRIS